MSLGLVGYDSDGSDADEANPRRSPKGEDSSGGASASGSVKVLEDNADSRQGDSVDDEAGASREARTGILRASSFDAPAPPSKESRQFFMPLPSPLVRLDNASPSASSPFITYEPPDGAAGGVGAEGEAGGAVDEENKDEGDGDVIKPEYRDMLPPEATGKANPELRAKIQKFLNRMQGDFTKIIKGKKDYGNPAVLAQVRGEYKPEETTCCRQSAVGILFYLSLICSIIHTSITWVPPPPLLLYYLYGNRRLLLLV